jgi:hypothetical protein
MSTTSPAILLRRLIPEIATVMQEDYTFRDIAEMFYEVGVIQQPESPYGSYDGNKREYVMEKLHEADSLDDFLRETVPRVVFNRDFEGPRPAGLIHTLKQLGYELDEQGREEDWALYSAPGGDLPALKAPAGKSPAPTTKRIDLPGLPNDVQELVDELNDNLARGNKNAAALLSRKIIQQSIYIAMSKRQKASLLKAANGDDVDLSVALARCGQEYGLGSQVMSRVTSAKWIADSANHSYRVKVNEADLDHSVTGLRLFLQELLSD